MRLSHFDYYLPAELIAQHPLEARDSSRLLVVDRSNDTIKERAFRDILSYIGDGDCVVLNNTKVIPARLMGKRKTGGKVEVFLYQKIDKNTYKVLLRPGNRVKPNEDVYFENAMRAKIGEDPQGGRVASFDGRKDFNKFLHETGQVPLPPYIRRNPIDNDKTRYQTVYAKNDGASAAPTAGLHFTEDLLGRIAQNGINLAYVTLHVSYGTFAPVKTDDIKGHKMHEEYFDLPKKTADIIDRAKTAKKSVLAVGTTSARALESCVLNGKVLAKKGWTDLFIYPGYEFKVVDKLLTNFHLPKSTLLLLVSAFAGRDLIFKAYDYAVKNKFRFFSYGDAMLII